MQICGRINFHPGPLAAVGFLSCPDSSRFFTHPMMHHSPTRIRILRDLMTLALTAAAAIAAIAESAVPEPVRMNVREIVRDVLARNPELRFYEAELAAARGEHQTAGQWVNPELGTQVGQKRSTDANSVLQGEGVAWSVSVSQTFEWPGRLALRKSIAERQVAMAENGIVQFRAALAARAQTLAFDLAVTRQLSEATLEAAERFLALQEIAIQRDPAGVAPLLETRILEANSITYRRRASAALRRTEEARNELNLLRGEPLSSQLQVSVDQLNFQPLTATEDLIASAWTNNFELRQRSLELEQQGFRVSLARNERYPAVTLSPYFIQENSAGQDRFAGVGISLPLPLWNRNKSTIVTAAAREQQAQTALRITQQGVERRVMELTAIYETRLREMSHWSADSVQRFREAAAHADRHYRLGAVPISTYVEMQKQSLDALEALLETRREAMEAAQQLELTTGTLLNLVTSVPPNAPDAPSR